MTDWLIYFIDILIQALKETVDVVQFVRKKTEFYYRYNAALNERQRKAINKMFNEIENKNFNGLLHFFNLLNNISFKP